MQVSTTGWLKCRVCLKATGAPVVGATVVATTQSAQGSAHEMTDEQGHVHLGGLAPGLYKIEVLDGDLEYSRDNVIVELGKLTDVTIAIDPENPGIIER